MKLSIPTIVVASLLGSGALLAAPADTGDRMRVTSKVEMQGMSLPGQTTEVCTERGGQVSQASIPKDKNCDVQNFRIEGSKASYHIVCTGKNAMTGDGEMESLPDGYRGRMKATVAGQSITMSYEGKRIGSCDYASESPQAQGRALTGKMCEAQLTSIPSYSMYVGPQAACPAYKDKFCANVSAKTAGLSDPAQFSTIERSMGPVIWPAVEACGSSRAKLLASACTRAESSDNLEFLGAQCPDLAPKHCASADPNRHGRFLAQHCVERARTLAAQQCTGRDYTAMQTSPYRNFCSSYAAERLRARNAGAAGARP